MKKFTIPAFAFFLLALSTHITLAQSPKYCLIEEFTQASCPPCASQNPGFEAGILQTNTGTVRHIAYHTSWPGVDPMYNLNASQSDSRVSYYGVTYVPDAFIEGNFLHAQPGSIAQTNVDSIVTETSPIKIKVTDVDNGTSHDVTVVVTSTGTPPTGNFVLRTVILEREINYSTEPGTNGETHFPNVFRKMLPGMNGDPITLPSVGNSVTFNYTYTEDAAWNMSEVALVSFVQDESTKEIVNCGTTFDPSANIADPTVITHAGTTGNLSSFTLDCGNTGDNSSDYSYSLTTDAPADWSGDFVVNGVTYTNPATVTVAAGATTPVTIEVTPGSSSAIASYTLTIQSLTDPNQDPISKSVYVISGVTELVVNNSTMAPTEANIINGIYNTAFSDIGTTTYGFMNSALTERAGSDNSLTGVKNIFYNAGWYFPAFTDDYVTQLKNFMNNGGNLFVSGQDVGWDVWTDPIDLGHGTALSQDFYTNYMFANWIADGGTSNKPLTANIADPIFGTLGTIQILPVYGSTYFYPDQIEPVGAGTSIFFYNNNDANIGGVRGDNGTYKSVYIAPGIEMLGSSANKTSIIHTAYNWFYGITGTGNINATAQQIGQNFPNPSDGLTYIPVSGLNEDMTFTVTDQLGRVLLSQPVSKTATKIEVNTASLTNGVYFYRLANGSQQGVTKTMDVIH